jgi:hypothetical protein
LKRSTEHWWNEIVTGGTEVLEENPIAIPLCPPQILHRMNFVRIRALAVKGRRLTACDMALNSDALIQLYTSESRSEISGKLDM